jgi:histidinol dehydrogenase
VPKVDKIFGPGNAYVTEAKRQVSQRLDGAAIDMPAGPSEVLVIADSGANPTLSPPTCCRRRNTARTRR